MRFLISVLLFGFSLLPFALCCQIQAQNDRPNIIFILTDDQRWDALGHSGNAIIKTPNMDRLAVDGTYFKNAFVTTPICAASRASIMTGLYERKHDYTFRQPPLKTRFIAQTYFTLLKSAGYHNGFFGKFGVNFENQQDSLLFDVYRPKQQGGYFRLNENGTQQRHLTDVMADEAIGFIKNAPNDRPFALSLSFHAPHAVDSSPYQYFWPVALDSLYQDIAIPDPLMDGTSDFNKLPEAVREGFNRARWRWRYDTPEKYQNMVKGYYRMISGIDAALGRIRKTLENQGIDKNTVIILMGDNGYFMGERQLAGKWLMYEPSLRVPLIIYNPKEKGGMTVDDMVLNIDVPSTILDFAKVDIPKTYQGQSLKEYTKTNGRHPKKRKELLFEHLWNFEPIPASEGVRTDKYKYFRYRDDPNWEELYDLENDPNEMHNLVNSKDYRKVLQELRQKCDTLIKKVSK
ncbi:sulfatase [Maribacter algicola]|uniref:Sulfatase n=1 Tax=Meishania litoralis TaxID=3434685 RepID=A0ACC7LM96_9FLAO